MWRLAGVMLVCIGAAGALAWAVFQPRADAADPEFTRDRIASAAAVHVTFEGQAGEGYQSRFELVHFNDGRWVMSNPYLVHQVMQVVYTGWGFLFRVAEGCYAATSDAAQLPLIPGVTVAPRLEHMTELERDGTSVAYQASPREGWALRVTEDLSTVGSTRTYRAHTAGTAPGALYGTYTVRAATDEEIGEALQLFRRRPSAGGNIVLRTRPVLAGVQGNVGAFTQVVVLKECPEANVPPPAARPPITGGPSVGSRSFRLVHEDGVFYLDGAVRIDASISASVEDILKAAKAAEPGPYPMKAGAVYAIGDGDGDSVRPAYLLVEILACGPNDVVRC